MCKLLFLILVLFAVVGCDGEDGKSGVAGITGPSGVNELVGLTCEDGEKIESTRGGSGEITLKCVTAE